MRGVFASCAIAALVLAVTLAFPEPHHHGHSHDGGHGHSHDGGHGHSHNGHGHSHGSDHDHTHPYHHAPGANVDHSRDTTSHKLFPHVTDFAVKVYANLKGQSAEEKNILFSPMGLSNALSMLLDGTAGVTYSQIFKLFNYDGLTPTQIFQAYEHINHMIVHHQGDQLLYGSTLVLCNAVAPNKHFVDHVLHYFYGDTFQVDLSNGQEALKGINKFVADKTKNKVPQMEKVFDPNTNMLLLSYVWFRGQWEHTFHPVLTTTQDFMVDATKTVQVPMMYKARAFDYFRDDASHVSVVKVPYKHNNYMMVVLPDEGKMGAVEAMINRDLITRWMTSLSSQEMELRLPKMTIVAETAMAEMLKAMGMPSAFSDQAIFSELSRTTHHHLTEMNHRTELVIDESGVDAAAAGDGRISDDEAERMLNGPAKVQVTVERPFLFFIINKDVKSILFMGKINDPTAL